ncbi:MULTISPECIES: glucose 1-dehydrogenase [unclassified Novosphingobium]|uniref:glucose 1-dehydrogenase n=1 Tax=unclassified Novosphingobium TaxID=2644732 RepID=UPI000D2FC0D5|nr:MULTISPECIES: glucose 1-dehydrogenase [unclassified Novosphingobium]PTR05431.1 3alpha(or 20beta)-hydroxysteroid dehydrogenase [Novosphingobium sp. GV055]PUA94021.1 3alpha(or 20beta)-hydroxysteroid dehydrogenase [Novosphingobium sp. GV061]PUB11478.1 3alpha(or 20beta)-hydroxysteroid dehydrogenase [Novosphingobium sp. GV079]PUB37075.1 3alpha(or 20beta)-hydroxysteroid dehydrogenase [Novosphingobium sp. GV027]
MGRLQGKVAIITGAAQGMGAAHARRFLAEGAAVTITDIDAERGEALARELGERAAFYRLDVADEENWAAVVDATEARFGPVTALVNNAGIIGSPTRCAELTQAEFQRVCAINQTAVFLGTKHVIPAMIRAGGGSIVNISSISGIVAIYGTPNVAYAASKFAVRGITKQVAIEYGKQGIRANSVHPGYIKTKMMTDALDEDGIRVASASVPIGRVGEVEDVSNLVVFLASDESGFITGSEYIIDGGLTAL